MTFGWKENFVLEGRFVSHISMVWCAWGTHHIVSLIFSFFILSLLVCVCCRWRQDSCVRLWFYNYVLGEFRVWEKVEIQLGTFDIAVSFFVSLIVKEAQISPYPNSAHLITNWYLCNIREMSRNTMWKHIAYCWFNSTGMPFVNTVHNIICSVQCCIYRRLCLYGLYPVIGHSSLRRGSDVS